jgi:hypothetical protein
MNRYVLCFLTLSLGLWSRPVAAAQYEATLLDERSVRYQTSFGLFKDDFDAFYTPRRLPGLEGRRFVAQLTDLSAGGAVSAGYARGATDVWSWSILGSGGYRAARSVRTVQTIHTVEGQDTLTQDQQRSTFADIVPTKIGEARVVAALGRQYGRNDLALSLQTAWSSSSRHELTAVPGLFTFASPDLTSRSSRSLIDDLDTGAEVTASDFRSSPENRDESLRAAAVLGYGRRPAEQGWGWNLDLLGGYERNDSESGLENVARATTSSGTFFERYETHQRVTTGSPVIGTALTLVRNGRRPLWLDLGGQVRTGADVSGEFAETRALRQVDVTTGGVERRYERQETRRDHHAGILGQEIRATAGFRQLVPLDPFLQMGWGANATWRQLRDENQLYSIFRIEESFEADGDGAFNDDESRTLANGESRASYEHRVNELDVRMPLGLMLRSAQTPGLEWRLGAELRYLNRMVVESSTLDSLTLPSGSRFTGDSRAAIRFANTTLLAGERQDARLVEISAALRAGFGYWFTETAKIDFLLSAEPTEGRFVDLSSPAFGVSALLAF